MYILGIETSCDETAVSVIRRGEQNHEICEKIKSQIPIHARYGGIVPELASRNHYEVIDFLTSEVLKESSLKITDIELISLTLGPGLLGSLIIGLSFAKGLSYACGIPVVTVDHIFSHIEAAFITNPGIEYPLIALVVSGGHTSVFYQESKFKSELLSKTRDDAAGEVLDKIANYFQIGYPGGPVIDKLYDETRKGEFQFTIPRMSDGSNDFSFSGYKTAVLRAAGNKNVWPGGKEFIGLISSFLHSVVDYLVQKTVEASREHDIKSVIVAGGVSCNSLLRRRFDLAFRDTGIKFFLPEIRFCTDNATMVAWRGYEKYTAFPGLNYNDLSFNSYSRMLKNKNLKYR